MHDTTCGCSVLLDILRTLLISAPLIRYSKHSHHRGRRDRNLGRPGTPQPCLTPSSTASKENLKIPFKYVDALSLHPPHCMLATPGSATRRTPSNTNGRLGRVGSRAPAHQAKPASTHQKTAGNVRGSKRPMGEHTCCTHGAFTHGPLGSPAFGK